MADCPGLAQSFHFMVNETLLDAVGNPQLPHRFDLEHRSLTADYADALAGGQVGA